MNTSKQDIYIYIVKKSCIQVNKPFEILNFSFRNGFLCLYIKDYVDNIHYVNFELKYLKNRYNNLKIKAFYGHLKNYIGELHALICDSIGLYSILESRLIEFEMNENDEKSSIGGSMNIGVKGIFVNKLTNSLYVMLLYPEDKILNLEMEEEEYRGDYSYSTVLANLDIEDVFRKGLPSIDKYYESLLGDESDKNIHEFQYKTREQIEYESIDDEDTKRDAFPDLWLEEQIALADDASYNEVKRKEEEELSNYYDLFLNLDHIQIINFETPNISLFIPPAIARGDIPNLIDIQMNTVSLQSNDIPDFYPGDYYMGNNDFIYIIAIPKSNFSQIEKIKSKLNLPLINYVMIGDFYIYAQLGNFNRNAPENEDLPFK